MGKKVNKANRQLQQNQKESRERFLELQKAFDESEDCAMLDGYMLLSYFMTTYITELLYESEKVLNNYGLITRLRSALNKMNDSIYKLIEQYDKQFEYDRHGMSLLCSYSTFKESADKFVHGWCELAVKVHTESNLESKYGKIVHRELFNECDIKVYKESKTSYMYHVNTFNNPKGWSGNGYPSIEQAIITCKNMLPVYLKQLNESLEERRKEIEQEKLRHQWILEHS